MTRTKALMFLGSAALALSGCDAATQVAGDAIKQEVRTRFIAQCEQLAENSGVATGNITSVCDCSADAFVADAADGELQIDQAKVEEVLKTCVEAQAKEAANG